LKQPPNFNISLRRLTNLRRADENTLLTSPKGTKMTIKAWIFEASYTDTTLNFTLSDYGNPIIIYKQDKEEAITKFKQVVPHQMEHFRCVGFISHHEYNDYDRLIYWNEDKRIIYKI
jgi:hypothetical protein